MNSAHVNFEQGSALILGGARSGKSKFAESVTRNSGRQKIYLATAEVLDDEMSRRVDHHQKQRGSDWELIEEPLDIAGLIAKNAGSDSCILVDCLTLWLTNLMMADKNIEAAIEELVATLVQLSSDSSVVLVSNEVGQGIVPIDKMAREFRDHAGRLHQEIAVVVQNVWFITAGLPQKLK